MKFFEISATILVLNLCTLWPRFRKCDVFLAIFYDTLLRFPLKLSNLKSWWHFSLPSSTNINFAFSNRNDKYVVLHRVIFVRQYFLGNSYVLTSTFETKHKKKSYYRRCLNLINRNRSRRQKEVQLPTFFT